MKIIIYILLAFSLNSYSHMTETVYLSYNLNNEAINENNRKTISKNGDINFYMRGYYFFYDKNSKLKYVRNNEIEKLTLNTLSEMIIYRNKLIKENQKNGIQKMVWDSEVFKQVYILEKKNDSILKYPVTWLDTIECL